MRGGRYGHSHYVYRTERSGASGTPVQLDANLPQPLLDSKGNRCLCIEVTNPVDGSKVILVHPDDYEEFVASLGTPLTLH